MLRTTTVSPSCCMSLAPTEIHPTNNTLAIHGALPTSCTLGGRISISTSTLVGLPQPEPTVLCGVCVGRRLVGSCTTSVNSPSTQFTVLFSPAFLLVLELVGSYCTIHRPSRISLYLRVLCSSDPTSPQQTPLFRPQRMKNQTKPTP